VNGQTRAARLIPGGNYSKKWLLIGFRVIVIILHMKSVRFRGKSSNGAVLLWLASSVMAHKRCKFASNASRTKVM
jgi:hypothetical protein